MEFKAKNNHQLISNLTKSLKLNNKEKSSKNKKSFINSYINDRTMLQSTFRRKITDNVIYNLRNRKMFMSQTVEKESKNGKNFAINLLMEEESEI